MVKAGKVRSYRCSWELEISDQICFSVTDSMPSLPSLTQLNTIIRQSNTLTAEHLCLIRACLIKQQKLNEQ